MGQRAISKNTLFYGDNLEIIRQYLADESIDLIYLDPPFNSNRNYNVLYKEESGTESTSQIKAFEDTWHWSYETEDQYRALTARGDKLGALLEALVGAMGRNQMTAYLVMMAIRLVELHRVLKPTGSLYLHCDPTASHYLKLLLDMIFGAKQFRNEMIWIYSRMAAKGQKQLSRCHDVIFWYSKSQSWVFNVDEIRLPYSEKSKARAGYKKTNLGGGSPKSQICELNELGKFPEDWIQIPFIRGKEYLGYPTQKPLTLLERILQASSNPGDVVLDPFCGCGTAIHAAYKLERIWVGIDITPLATTLIKSRLYSAFKIEAKKDYELLGEPTTLTDAHHLAQQDRYQFQWWALGLLPAFPYGGQGDSKQGKKGSDKGIDGIMTFRDSGEDHEKRIIVQVKSGKVSSRDIRDLNGTVDREKNAVIGVFITLEPPSRNMVLEALELGRYKSVVFKREYPKIQILTLEDLLNGAKVQFPGTDTTLKQAQREEPNLGEQKPLL